MNLEFSEQGGRRELLGEVQDDLRQTSSDRVGKKSRVCFVSGASSRTIPGQNREPAENIRLARTVSQVLAAEGPGGGPAPARPRRPPTPTGLDSEKVHSRRSASVSLIMHVYKQWVYGPVEVKLK
eukprot:764323-Hanusia_phi.AAC.2